MILHYRFVITHVTYVHIHLLFSCWSFCVGKKPQFWKYHHCHSRCNMSNVGKNGPPQFPIFFHPFLIIEQVWGVLDAGNKKKGKGPRGVLIFEVVAGSRECFGSEKEEVLTENMKKSRCKIIQVDIVPCLFLQQMRYDMTWFYRAFQPETSWNLSSVVRENSESPCLVSRASGKCRTEQESESKAAKTQKKGSTISDQKFFRLPKSYEVKVVGVVDGCRL